jgi:hypothetical protein
VKAALRNVPGAPHRFRWRRIAGLLILTALVAAVVAYLQVSVPVAVIAGLLVVILTAAVVLASVWAGMGKE